MTKKLNRRTFLLAVPFISCAAIGVWAKFIREKNGSGKPAAGEATPVSQYLSSEKPPVQTSAATAPASTATAATNTTTAPKSKAPTAEPSATKPRVVHIHADDATSWNNRASYYWEYVHQDVVDSMVDQGVMALTGQATLVAAWQAILPHYQPGQGIAVKVSFNNANTCSDDNGGKIDAVVEPVLAIIRGLKSIGVQEADIWCYDPIRVVPPKFTGPCLSAYPGVKIYDNSNSGCNLETTWTSTDADALVSFSPPVGSPPKLHRLTDTVVNATYLINIPILKRHTMSGVSMAFKNHYGSMVKPQALHEWSTLSSPHYRSSYSPFVTIYQNPHIGKKTVLTVGDALFCAFDRNRAPEPWMTFNGQTPRSLFFAFDPVAIDSVMLDFLSNEMAAISNRGPLAAGASDYLKLAARAGLGVYEHIANPFTQGYANIDYQKIEI